MRPVRKLALAGRNLVAFFVVALFIVAIVANTHAANAIGEEANQQGLQISTLVINLNAEKGKTYQLNVTVTNVTTNNMTVSSVINDFTTKDESGSPKILVDGTSNRTGYSFRGWVEPIQPFSLKAKESKPIQIAVNVPSNAEAGGHYGVVRFNAKASSDSGNVATILSTGVLVLTRVEGKIVEKLTLKDLLVTQDGKLTIVARLQNKGNVHVIPQGHLTVRNMFGSTVANYTFGSKNANVLPASIRRYEQVIDKSRLFGRYTVELDAGYGTNGQVIIAEKVFWVIPFKTILIILTLLVTAAVLLRRFIKRYNSHIIKKAHTKSKK